MLKYCYGTLINTSAPHFKGILRPNVDVFVNIDKIKNFVPYISTLVSYVPFFTEDSIYFTFKHGDNNFCLKYKIRDTKYDSLNVKILGVECSLVDDSQVPEFLKVYKNDEFISKYFPDYPAKFYMKQYNVETLQPISSDIIKSVISEKLSKEIKDIKSYEIDNGLSCFEAEYIEN